MYKIYNPEKDLYSAGGSPIRWSKEGRIWKKISHIKNHIRGVVNWRQQNWNEYEDCIIVEFELNPIANINIDTVIEEMQDSDKKRHDEYVKITEDRVFRELGLEKYI